MKAIIYLLARLKEPGSIRSLVILLFLLKGQAVDDAMVEQIVTGVIGLLTLGSFLIPEAQSVAVAKAEEVLASANATKAEAVEILGDVQARLLKLTKQS